MSQLPIPSNMEGQGRANPYSRLNTMFNPRLIASDVAMGALPGPTGVLDRVTGNRIRNFADRVTGATGARNQRDYDAYMRGLMRDDPGNERNSFGSRLRNWFSQTFGSGEASAGNGSIASGHQAPQFSAYSAPVNTGSQWGAGGPAPMLQFQQFLGPSMTPQPLYGTGQGMMRNPPAPLYGTGQGMMRAPSGGGEGGGGGGSGGGSGGSSSGGGALSPGGRLLSHGVATRIY